VRGVIESLNGLIPDLVALIRPLQLYADRGYQLRIRSLEGTPNYGPRHYPKRQLIVHERVEYATLLCISGNYKFFVFLAKFYRFRIIDDLDPIFLFSFSSCQKI
jgi:hypothetical protein